MTAIIYGRNPVREALRGERDVHRIWVTSAAAREPWLAGKPGGAEVTRAENVEIAALADTDDHQGICAEVSEFVYRDGEGLLTHDNAIVLVLDEIQDPQNLGSLIRVAECAGATGVVIGERRSAEVTAAVCKASAGAVEHVPIARVTNIADYLLLAKNHDAWVYGAAAEGSVRFDAPDYNGKVVMVVGSEGRGLRTRVASACDQLVSIPLLGKIDSLNVSTAAAVLLYAVLQDRLQKKTPADS